MGLLDSLFSGAKVFVREVLSVAAETAKAVLTEIDRSAFGRAVTSFVEGATRRYFNSATDLADEERELHEKYRRDGRRTSADEERLREIEKERDRLKKDLEEARRARAEDDFRRHHESVVKASVSDDEASANVGIISSKVCPECGETMRIRQGGFNQKTERRSFFWQCSSATGTCPTVKLDPTSEGAHVLRKADPNLDLDVAKRRAIWQRKDILVETATRMRQGLGDDDDEIVCPHHLTPMKLLPRPNGDGRLLLAYEYVCLGVDGEGRACAHRLPLETFPQVSEALRRRDGRGIIH